LMAVVVLPTPPFWLAMATIIVSVRRRGSAHRARAVRERAFACRVCGSVGWWLF
jgi:hypothetical protein